MARAATHTLRNALRRVFRPSQSPFITEEAQLPPRVIRQLDELGERLSAWAAAKRYCRRSPNLDQTVKELGTDKYLLFLYFRLRIGEDFRTWRTRLRIQEAQRLFREDPSLPASEAALLTGFNDRSNFSRQFIHHSGLSVTDWKRNNL